MVRVGEKGGEALALLFRRYSRLVRALRFAFCAMLLRADDLPAEVFLFVHRKASIFDPQQGFGPIMDCADDHQRAIDRRRYLQSRHFYHRVDLDGLTNLPTPAREGKRRTLDQPGR